jgi:hypothetical protein
MFFIKPIRIRFRAAQGWRRLGAARTYARRMLGVYLVLTTLGLLIVWLLAAALPSRNATVRGAHGAPCFRFGCRYAGLG